MNARIAARGLDGLAARIAARALPPAQQAAATRAAEALATEITTETDAPAVVAGPPGRPLVRVAGRALLERIRGSFNRPGDPVLDRIRLVFQRARGRRS